MFPIYSNRFISKGCSVRDPPVIVFGSSVCEVKGQRGSFSLFSLWGAFGFCHGNTPLIRTKTAIKSGCLKFTRNRFLFLTLCPLLYAINPLLLLTQTSVGVFFFISYKCTTCPSGFDHFPHNGVVNNYCTHLRSVELLLKFLNRV